MPDSVKWPQGRGASHRPALICGPYRRGCGKVGRLGVVLPGGNRRRPASEPVPHRRRLYSSLCLPAASPAAILDPKGFPKPLGSWRAKSPAGRGTGSTGPASCWPPSKSHWRRRAKYHRRGEGPMMAAETTGKRFIPGGTCRYRCAAPCRARLRLCACTGVVHLDAE